MSETDLLSLLLALLPGLVTAEVLDALTVPQKRDPLERIIRALLFTFLCHATWLPLRDLIDSIGRQPETGEVIAWSHAQNLLALSICAIAWGLVGTWIVNAGQLHRFLRRVGLTKRASRPSQWYDAFYRTTEDVVVHLKDGRRLQGWPKLFPDYPKDGHFFLTRARWLDSDQPDDEHRITILISVDDVKFVEFSSEEVITPMTREDPKRPTSPKGPTTTDPPPDSQKRQGENPDPKVVPPPPPPPPPPAPSED